MLTIILEIRCKTTHVALNTVMLQMSKAEFDELKGLVEQVIIQGAALECFMLE